MESSAGHPPIDLPSVISLEIDIRSYRNGEDNIIKTFSHTSRLYPNLRFLKVVYSSEYFHGAQSSVATTLEFISLFPSVREVAFHNVDPTPIFHALYGSRSTGELPWPQLSSVTVVLPKRTTVSCKKLVWADIVKLVGNRAQIGHPISSVKLPLEIIVRGTQRQQQRLREQVTVIEC